VTEFELQPRRLKRRASGLFAALVAVVFTVAFSNAAGGSTGGLTGPPRGGTLRAGLLFLDELSHYTELPPGYDYFLDPQAGYTTPELEFFRCCLLRTLLSYNGHPTAQGGAELHPDLAVSMPEVSQDRLSWTFRLKQGLHYAPPFAHTEIKSQDIVRALERDLSPLPRRVAHAIGSNLGSYRFYYMGVIAGAQEYAEGKADTISGLETPDDHTLVVHLLRPAGDLGYRLSLPAAAPIPPNPRKPSARLGAAQGHNTGYGRFLVASGPYMIAGSQRLDFSLPASRQKPVSGYVWQRTASGLVHAKSLTFVRNPSWDPRSDSLRKAYLDRIELTFGGTAAGDAAAVDKGALDMVFDRNPPVDQVRRYLTDPRLKKRVFRYPGDLLYFLPMNLALPPFDDVHVRRAVNWAIDKAGLVRLGNSKPSFFIGPLYGTVATHVGVDSVEDGLLQNYDPYGTPANEGDLRAARREMAKSRYDRNHDGICDAPACKNLLAVTWMDTAQPAMAALVRKDLKRIGIDLRIKVKREVYFDSGREAPPRAKIALLIGAQTWPDYPNGSTFFVPNFYGPELSLGKVGVAVTNLSLLGATPEELHRWGYGVTSVPSVDGRINDCVPLLGLAQIECWATLDQYLMEKVVPWVPFLRVGYAYTVSARVRNFTWGQFTGLAALDQIAVAPTR
jgi:peptide/nickel transport system substrate-binding protein